MSDKKQKKQKPKTHYVSKGQRRSSMKTRGVKSIFIDMSKNVKHGWTAAQRATAWVT